jgi:hypothetical protein
MTVVPSTGRIAPYGGSGRLNTRFDLPPSIVATQISAQFIAMVTTPERPPQILGNRYALGNINRLGAQAIVTQAFDTLKSRPVAIKRMRFGPADERAREGLQREVQMLQDLRHTNIVEMIDVDRDGDGNWYIVLEWLPDNLDAFAAVTLSYLTGRIFDREEDPLVALQEAVVPSNIRAILDRCLHKDASKRPEGGGRDQTRIRNPNGRGGHSTQGEVPNGRRSPIGPGAV